MNELTRDTLGAIWRICSQMEYAAQEGNINLLWSEYYILQRHMAKLNTVVTYIAGNA